MRQCRDLIVPRAVRQRASRRSDIFEWRRVRPVDRNNGESGKGLARFQQTGAPLPSSINWARSDVEGAMEEPLQRCIAAAGYQQTRIVLRKSAEHATLPEHRRRAKPLGTLAKIVSKFLVAVKIPARRSSVPSVK